MEKYYHTSQVTPDEDVLYTTCKTLLAEGVVVVPTDSVYGIACAVTNNNHGYRRIYDIKMRPVSMKLPWLIADINQLDDYGQDVPGWAYKLAEKMWPGALTLVVQASQKVPDEYKAEDGTIALRLPNSNFVREVIRRLGCPIAATSANLHGNPSATSADMLDQKIVDQVDIVISAGEAPVAIESTIVDCTKDVPVIVRQGALSAPEIEVICSERSN